jgi:hypothetical protein
MERAGGGPEGGTKFKIAMKNMQIKIQMGHRNILFVTQVEVSWHSLMFNFCELFSEEMLHYSFDYRARATHKPISSANRCGSLPWELPTVCQTANEATVTPTGIEATTR